MCPITHTSLLAIVGAVIASFVFGFLWYGPLFGKTWATLAGIKMDDKKCCKPPLSSLFLTLFGNFLTTLALAYIIHVYNASCPFTAAFVAWIGFYVPLMLGSVTWEGKPWAFFGLNAVYSFLSLQIIVAILTFVK